MSMVCWGHVPAHAISEEVGRACAPQNLCGRERGEDARGRVEPKTLEHCRRFRHSKKEAVERGSCRKKTQA